MADTHDEWIDLNPLSKGDAQTKARNDKAEIADKAKDSVSRSYRVYRRAGLKPQCALRYMFQHKLEKILA